MEESVQIAVLRRALELAGGITALSGAIGARGNLLLAMLDGRREIPPAFFLRLVDFVNEAQAEQAQHALNAERHEGIRTKQ